MTTSTIITAGGDSLLAGVSDAKYMYFSSQKKTCAISNDYMYSLTQDLPFISKISTTYYIWYSGSRCRCRQAALCSGRAPFHVHLLIGELSMKRQKGKSKSKWITENAQKVLRIKLLGVNTRIHVRLRIILYYTRGIWVGTLRGRSLYMSFLHQVSFILNTRMISPKCCEVMMLFGQKGVLDWW